MLLVEGTLHDGRLGLKHLGATHWATIIRRVLRTSLTRDCVMLNWKAVTKVRYLVWSLEMCVTIALKVSLQRLSPRIIA